MQATSRLRIGGTMICSRTVRGFDFGSVMEFAAARDITARTRASAATIGCKRGTGFQYTGAGRLLQTPPVSNVFHSCPQVHNHLSSLRGDQPHSGQRMRGVPGSFSPSRSRSGAKTGLSATGLMAFIVTHALIIQAG